MNDESIQVKETRSISLPKGGVLEVAMSQAFIDKLRDHFELSNDQPIEDDHIRMFIYGATNTAVTKAEKQLGD